MILFQEEQKMYEQVKTEIENKLGLEVKGFEWIGGFKQAYKKHFVEFVGWNGEIYAFNKGILSNIEYYQEKLNAGICLYIEGMFFVKAEGSTHYNTLHKEHIKQLNQFESSSEEDYPVVNPSVKPIFESSVQLYKQGFFNLEQLMVRIQRYIQPEKQEQVLATLTK